ncbi:hypothetical protein [Yoonia litorea]|uniref:PRC-barrel domain-containing protein n=1 Tax=Yoonia litorea TaxID=1123755 RepID=A0A1I6LNC6_9RHOB|nr:hypothetical protein [Yoonia litorea]SFS05004.1 hypothetical protein SAMN05444714_0737 [Yoonia litorea]
MVNASDLIGQHVEHASETAITGTVRDILFSENLRDVLFFLVETKSEDATAPLLFSPSMLDRRENDGMVTAAHPDDLRQQVAATAPRAALPLDVSDLPSTLIGPFGNTISPMMMAALFNSRSKADRPPLPGGEAMGLWLTELKDTPLRAHVGEVGKIVDVILSDAMDIVEQLSIERAGEDPVVLPHGAVRSWRSADDQLLLGLN